MGQKEKLIQRLKSKPKDGNCQGSCQQNLGISLLQLHITDAAFQEFLAIYRFFAERE